MNSNSFYWWIQETLYSYCSIEDKDINSEYADLITLIKGMFWNLSNTNYIPAESLKKCSIIP